MSYTVIPAEGAVVNTSTELQREFIRRIRENGIEEAIGWLKPMKGDLELSYPASIPFFWQEDGSRSYLVELCEENSFTRPLVCRADRPFCFFTNLKVNTQYYWRVNRGRIRSFRTAGEDFRFIRIDGLLNVRDLGGIGIRQGLIYRGSEMDGYSLHRITPAGAVVFRDELGMRTEVNLRLEKPGEPEFANVGAPVKYKKLPYRPYLEAFEPVHREELCRIMEFFAEEENYPIYFHCRGGADRTGMIAMLLRAIAGESDEDILADYELTSLSSYADGVKEGVPVHGFRSRNGAYFTRFTDHLPTFLGLTAEEAEGLSLRDKLMMMLTACGVSDETIRDIRRIIANR